MATIRICDYTKRPLNKGEKSVIVKVGEKEFEVGQEGARQLLAHFEADGLPQMPTALVRAVERPVGPPAVTVVAAPPQLDVQTNTDPFDAGPGSMPETPKAETSDDKPLQLEIPQDLKKHLGVPPKSTWERVMREAKRFEPGTLASLSPGSPNRKDANQKLEKIQTAEEEKLRRKAGDDIKFKSLN